MGVNIIDVYNKAIHWIDENSIPENGIAVSNKLHVPYPEVTGYYIPTLLQWGYKERAKEYAKWLCQIQHDNGSWYSPDETNPYVFDSAQVLKGLLAISEEIPEVKQNILDGCNWIMDNIQTDGRLSTPCIDAWGDGSACKEIVHLYCLSPLIEAADKFDMPKYRLAAEKVLTYYKKYEMEDIKNFNLLSHFYAYIMEALIDLGEIELAKDCMERIGKIQKNNGAVPAYKNAKWICSTGIFQFAVVWYKLGMLEQGNKAFDYACSLQNESGGWFGSYKSGVLSLFNLRNCTPNYFTNSEISWAIKYFLDSLYYKCRLEFENMSDLFSENIDRNDGRYQLVMNWIVENKAELICDVGCGRGRYLSNLIHDYKEAEYFGVDISMSVMKNIDKLVAISQGAMTNLPYPDEMFDFVYTIEALEHAIEISNAIKELVRITKKGGTILVIDKNKDKLGKLELAFGEQWFDDEQMTILASANDCKIDIIKNIPYEAKADGLFSAWILKKY